MLAAAALFLLAATPGLAIGSFLNVVASRVPAAIPIGTSRSRCLGCASEIAWYDNLPLLSYAVLRGRCRSCAGAIPFRYPAVEALSALLAGLCLLRFGLTPLAVLAAGFCLCLVVLSAIDLEHRIVPNRIVVPAAGVALVARTLVDPSPEWAIAAVAAAAGLLAAALAYPRGMGDVRLCLLLGAMLGRSVVVALAIGMVTAILPGVVAAVRRRPVRGLVVPFVPFLALGSVIALFLGDRLLSAYLELL